MVHRVGFGAIRGLAVLMLVAAVAVIALASPGAARAQDDASVDIFDFGFDSPSITIEAGSTVTWTNTGNAPHTVTADDGTFDSGTLDNGGTFSFTFDTPGTYTYHCEIHPNMTAEIVVTEAGGAGTTGGDGGNASGGDDSGNATGNVTGGNATGDNAGATGDDASDSSVNTTLPTTGTGAAAPHNTPIVLFAIAVALMAGGILTVQRRSAR
jgi:plastocyanin